MISGSVVGAAVILNVTQPGISRTIALLESRLGYTLFHRKGRRLVPTTEAEALYREIGQLYAGVERVAQLAQDLLHHRAGALRLTVLPALAHWLLPQVLAQFLEARSQVTVFVQSLPSRQIADLVSTRQFDLGIIELPLSKAGVNIEPLPSAPLVAVVPAQHRLSARAEIALTDLAAERLVLPSLQSYVRYQLDAAFNQLGITAQSVVETPTSPIAFAVAAAGGGIALVSHWVPPPGKHSRYVIKPLKAAIRSQYGMLTPAGSPSAALASKLCEMLARAMRQGARAQSR